MAYKYNPDGIRVAKIDDPDGSPVTTTYLIDSYNHTGYAHVLEETIDDGITTTLKTYTIGDDILSQATDSGSAQHLLYDGHGSTRQLVSSSSAVVDAYSYDAYGVMLGGNPTPSSPAATNLLYSGEYFGG